MQEADCKFHVIAKNDHVARTSVPNAMDKLSKAVNKTQQNRNIITHRRSYEHEDLYEVELHSVFQKNQSPPDTVFLKITGHTAKLKADEFIMERRVEMDAINTTVYQVVATLFGTLIQPYSERFAAHG